MPSLRQLLGLVGPKQLKKLEDELKKIRKSQGEDSRDLKREFEKLKTSFSKHLGGLEPQLAARPGTMPGMIKRLHREGYDIGTIIDVGASDGQWSRLAMEWFTACRYLLVEAQPYHEKALAEFTAGKPNVSVAMAAAGSKLGEVHFDATDPFGGRALDNPHPSKNIVVPMTTLDHEVSSRGLKGPFLIKFDTHGYEVPILEGASETLKNTSAIVMECYNFPLGPGSLMLPDMCAYLGGLGFRMVDMGEVVHRESDGALWQMDVVFVRNDRAEFACKRFR